MVVGPGMQTSARIYFEASLIAMMLQSFGEVYIFSFSAVLSSRHFLFFRRVSELRLPHSTVPWDLTFRTSSMHPFNHALSNSRTPQAGVHGYHCVRALSFS